MSPAICDSEDEDDEILIEGELAQTGVMSAVAGGVGKNLAQFDGADERATGSTARLEADINSAALDLFNSSSGQSRLLEKNMDSKTSVTTSSQQRQHTAPVRPQLSGSPGKSGRRSRSFKHCSAKRDEASRTQDHGELATFRNDHVVGKALPSIKSSEYSVDHSCSNALPEGTMLSALIQHEPTVMFQDSGDTIEYDASCQARMLNEATSNGCLNGQRLPRQFSSNGESSSLLFPSSSSTDVLGASADPCESKASQAMSDSLNVEHAQGFTAQLPSNETVVEDAQAGLKGAPPLSPIVEIPRLHSKESMIWDSAPAACEAGSRNERESQDESVDSPDSDDIAIGLPRDSYKPRPSRRRNTQIPNEAIDYSVVPEKAMKKQRKSSNNAMFHGKEEPTDNQSIDSWDGNHEKQTLIPHASERGSYGTVIHGPENDCIVDNQDTTSATTISAISYARPDGISTDMEVKSGIKPMGPPKLPSRSNKRSKRSHTTIFEDHLTDSPRSPSLNQQQADRRSVLKERSNAAVTPPRRQSKRVVVDENDDDHDDEDELARLTPVKESATKKHGRKRSAPADADSNLNPAGLSNVPEAEDSDKGNQRAEADHISKRKKRGRPPKAKRDEPHMLQLPSDTISADQGFGDDEIDNAAPRDQYRDSPEKETLQRESITVILTPQSDNAKANFHGKLQASPAGHSGPTSHSPIKSTAKVEYRVGLSRRQRIQPLHASIRRK